MPRTQPANASEEFPKPKGPGRYIRIAAVLVVLLGPVALILLLNQSRQVYQKLPIAGERTVGPAGDTVYHRLPDFAFESTAGPLTADSLRGRMHVASFIFTSCPGVCPKITSAMARVQGELAEAWRRERDVRLVSYSIDPKRDSLPVLVAYARRHGANLDQWRFARGPQEQVFALALRGYLVPVALTPGAGEDGFTHTEALVLVDPQLRVRGFYNGTSGADVKKLLEEIKVLRLEIREGKK